jgi:hypothetical protein
MCVLLAENCLSFCLVAPSATPNLAAFDASFEGPYVKMPHLNAHTLTYRDRAKAVADYGFLGYAVIRKLVTCDTCDDLLAEAQRSKDFGTIFNADTKSKESPQITRAAAKAGPDADALMQSVHRLLEDMLIIGETHVWGLGRGCSFLKTPPLCLEQVPLPLHPDLAHAHH